MAEQLRDAMETPKIPFDCSRRSLKFLKEPMGFMKDRDDPFSDQTEMLMVRKFNDSIPSRVSTL